MQNDFSKALKNPDLGLMDKIDDFAIPLYYEEMRADCIESQVNMKFAKYKIIIYCKFVLI